MADLNIDALEDLNNRELYESEMALRTTMNTIGVGILVFVNEIN